MLPLSFQQRTICARPSVLGARGSTCNREASNPRHFSSPCGLNFIAPRFRASGRSFQTDHALPNRSGGDNNQGGPSPSGRAPSPPGSNEQAGDSSPQQTAASQAGSQAGQQPAGVAMRSLPPPSAGGPDPGPPRRPPRLPLNLAFGLIAKLFSWLGQSLTKASKDPNMLTVMRLFAITAGCFLMGLVRGLVVARGQAAPQEVLYSTFVTLLDDEKVRAARMESSTNRIYFDMRGSTADVAAEASVASSADAVLQTRAGSQMQKRFYVKMVEKNDSYLVSRILARGVEFSIVKASFEAAVAKVFVTTLAVWLPLTPLLFMMQRMMNDRSSVGNKKKNSGLAENVTVKFADVAGVDGAKVELMEVVNVMKAVKQSYSALKVKMPSGVLLCGPPGTGKTLLAKAVAGEAGVPFIAVSASEFVEMYVGRGAARIRELFAEARKVSPCVVFIDELDAVGSKRGMGSNDERDQTLNQLLVELDGFEERNGVLFLAATNRIDVLDSALLRPGRISRKVVVPVPDEAGRRDILNVHLRGVPMIVEDEKPLVVQRLAAATAGFSGAELANVVNEASLMAARDEREHLTILDLLDGVRRTRGGVDGRTGMGPGNSFLGRLQQYISQAAASGLTTGLTTDATPKVV